MKTTIFEKMEEKNFVYGTSNPTQLHFTMIKLKEIRNAVMHNNSVEIVTRYVNSSYSKNSYRKPTPRKAYEQLIEKLKINNI